MHVGRAKLGFMWSLPVAAAARPPPTHPAHAYLLPLLHGAAQYVMPDTACFLRPLTS